MAKPQMFSQNWFLPVLFIEFILLAAMIWLLECDGPTSNQHPTGPCGHPTDWYDWRHYLTVNQQKDAKSIVGSALVSNTFLLLAY